MKNLKKWITSTKGTFVLFVLAAGLLAFSTIGSAWAALKYFSEIYKGHVEMYGIGVSLMEKDAHDDTAEIVAYRDYVRKSQDEWTETPGEEHVGELLKGMLGEGEELIPGKVYPEEISCKNTGYIDEYVRITLYKYWIRPDGTRADNIITDKMKEDAFIADGKKLTTQDLSPDAIQFTFPNLGSDWILDTDNSAETEERQIYYYNKLLKVGEDTTATPLTDTIKIDPSIARYMKRTESDDGKTITLTYRYDGWQFCVEAVVDAVQDHNAEDAIRSAWGRDVKISNGTLTLVND